MAIDRREFLKMAGLGILGLAVAPLIKSLPEMPAAKLVPPKRTMQDYLDEVEEILDDTTISAIDYLDDADVPTESRMLWSRDGFLADGPCYLDEWGDWGGAMGSAFAWKVDRDIMNVYSDTIHIPKIARFTTDDLI